MLFSVIVSFILVAVAFFIDQVVSGIIADMMHVFDDNFITRERESILTDATEEELAKYCPLGMEGFLRLTGAVSILSTLVTISGLGYLTAVI